MKYALIATILILSTHYANAQGVGDEKALTQAANTFRYKVLSDSLGMNKMTIGRLIKLRSNFLDSSAQVASKFDTSASDLTFKTSVFRRRYLEEVRKLLGNSQFDRYRAFIVRRMHRRGVHGKPLTED